MQCFLRLFFLPLARSVCLGISISTFCEDRIGNKSKLLAFWCNHWLRLQFFFLGFYFGLFVFHCVNLLMLVCICAMFLLCFYPNKFNEPIEQYHAPVMIPLGILKYLQLGTETTTTLLCAIITMWVFAPRFMTSE